MTSQGLHPDDLKRTVYVDELVKFAHDLKSEHGENPEYDRALVELVCDAASLPMDYKKDVADAIGIINFKG